MAVSVGLDALEQAWSVAHPEVLNRDHGAQLPRAEWTRRWAEAGLQISLEGRGRALDHIVVERLWRTVTSEAVSLKDDETPPEALRGFAPYVAFDKDQRLHQARAYQTPAAVSCSVYV